MPLYESSRRGGREGRCEGRKGGRDVVKLFDKLRRLPHLPNLGGR